MQSRRWERGLCVTALVSAVIACLAMRYLFSSDGQGVFRVLAITHKQTAEGEKCTAWEVQKDDGEKWFMGSLGHVSDVSVGDQVEIKYDAMGHSIVEEVMTDFWYVDGDGTEKRMVGYKPIKSYKILK